MSPTNKLRFVMRPTHASTGPFFIRVLQQWWEPDYPGSAWPGEWRDVPLEVEEGK